jgi:AcrR family transcriptional regulator
MPARRARRRSTGLYETLPPGTHGIEAAAVRRHQRARIQGALIAVAARDGYADATIARIVDLAGVSHTSFYEHFAGKPDCFLQTHALIVELGIERVAQAHRAAPEGLRERLRAAFAEFFELVVAEPEAARVVLVEARAAGELALGAREHAIAAFQGLLEQSFASAGIEPSPLTLRAIVGGVQRIVYGRLRDGRAGELPALVDQTVDWALSYHAPGVEPPDSPDAPAAPAGEPAAPSFALPGPALPEARLELTQRERILQAVLAVVARAGYRGLTIPAITAAAGVSNQGFYQHFAGKEDAFAAAFDAAAAEALDAITQAFARAPNLSEAVRDAIAALLEHTATHPAFARIAFFEPLTPGSKAQERAERTLERFVALVSPGAERPAGVPAIAEQAVAGGLFLAIEGELAHGRLEQLPQLTASLTYVALAPFIGAAAAARIAGRAATA